MMSGGGRKTIGDAISYVGVVRVTLKDEGEKYNYFLDLMADVGAKRIKEDDAIARVKELFKGHTNLIMGLNAFLQQPPLRKPCGFQEAVKFVEKIKTLFQGNRDVYQSFLDIMNTHRRANKSITQLHSEVAVLFQGHTDLIDEFRKWLPKTAQDPLMLLCEQTAALCLK